MKPTMPVFAIAFRTVPSMIALSLGTVLIASGSTLAAPFTPPTGGAPSGRGGASRGEVCAANPVKFTQQFLPIKSADSQDDLTLAEHPTFLVNVPESTAKKLFFIVKDESGTVHYQTTLPIPDKHGILQISLPTSVPPLVVDKQYEWGVAIICSNKLKPDSPFISSKIRRIAPPANLINQLTKANTLDRVALYGTNRIWYDAVATLASSRKNEPNNSTLQSAWNSLLNQAGLGELTSQPLQ